MSLHAKPQRKVTVYACLAVTCHWLPALLAELDDRDLLRATAVTRGGWNGYRNKSQHRKSTLEKKILPTDAPAGIRTRDFSITSQAL